MSRAQIREKQRRDRRAGSYDLRRFHFSAFSKRGECEVKQSEKKERNEFHEIQSKNQFLFYFILFYFVSQTKKN